MKYNLFFLKISVALALFLFLAAGFCSAGISAPSDKKSDKYIVTNDSLPVSVIKNTSTNEEVFLPTDRKVLLKSASFLSDAEYINSLIKYNSDYPFIKYDQNFFEWRDSKQAAKFFTAIGKTGTRKAKIVHIGDSHVQIDIFTGYIRNQLQEIFGIGGRGFFFPYSAAKTNSASDYITSFTGTWYDEKILAPSPTLDLGLTGVTIRTESVNSGFKIVFRENPNRSDENRLKIYCKKAADAFDVVLQVSSVGKPFHLKTNSNAQLPYISIDIPSSCESIEISFEKGNSKQTFFECYGLLLESLNDGGIVYNSVGTNSASLSCILRENLMPKQIAELKPDLVVLDLGTNDIFYGSVNAAAITSDINAIIKRIKDASPETAILLCSVQSIYRKSNEVKEAKQFAGIVRDIAYKNGCMFYDFYNVSGGVNSMQAWYENGLSQADKVHLSGKGYYLRGDLFVNALLNSYQYFLRNKSKSLDIEKKVYENKVMKQDNAKAQTVLAGQKNYHKVQQGDNLFDIATLYRVSVEEIKTWNNLSDDNILAGSSLLVYGNKTVNASINATATPGKVEPPAGSTIHNVQAGESLYSIATKYGITIAELESWNNILNGTIYPETKLTILSRGAITNTSNSASDVLLWGTEMSYVVQAGDNLVSLGKFFGVSENEIRIWNGLPNSEINAGTKLVIWARTNVGKMPSKK